MFGSTDIQIATAGLLPPEQITEDFGHIDMRTADEAADLVWEPLLNWIGELRGCDAPEEYPAVRHAD